MPTVVVHVKFELNLWQANCQTGTVVPKGTTDRFCGKDVVKRNDAEYDGTCQKLKTIWTCTRHLKVQKLILL